MPRGKVFDRNAVRQWIGVIVTSDDAGAMPVRVSVVAGVHRIRIHPEDSQYVKGS